MTSNIVRHESRHLRASAGLSSSVDAVRLFHGNPTPPRQLTERSTHDLTSHCWTSQQWHTSAANPRARTHARPAGMTLLEVIIAMFIFLIGILSVMLAIPSGINAASLVVFQDASIHLSQSKFSEFRRDRVDPAVDLAPGPYLNGSGQLASGRRAGLQEPLNGDAGEWRDFAHGKGDTYEYFDDIERYEWKIDKTLLKDIGVSGLDAQNFKAPIDGGGGTSIGLTQVTIVIRLKGTEREFRFTQYMCAYDGN